MSTDDELDWIDPADREKGTTLRWFGEPFGVFCDRPELEVHVPADARCDVCPQPLVGRSGIRLPHIGTRHPAYTYYHRECLRNLFALEDGA